MAFGQDDPRLASTLDHLAWVLSAEGKTAEAETLAKAALVIREKKLGANHEDVAASLNTLACLYDLAGRTAQRGPFTLAVWRLPRRSRAPRIPASPPPSTTWRRPIISWGRFAEAEAEYKRALTIREKAAEARPAELAPTLHNLGALSCRPEEVRGG